MKLQKLTIHNIASIKDATIDFEAQPLSDSEVFLITGDTGSGKSTILDAICLALFADTPRLDGTQMQGKTPDVNQGISLSDPRQLLRRDAGEAFVTLTFTGNDDMHYRAEWTVERAYKKIDGNLKGKDWKLTDLDTPHVYDKDDEIRQQMAKAVGLAFDQFCRTTMLAQGEFTRFLDSKDDKKAEILEKITGTDTYTKVGKKIYDITSDKKRKLDDVNLILGGISDLDENQLKTKNDELGNLNALLNDIQKAYDADKSKLDWINEEAKRSKAVSDTIQKHHDAIAVVEGDDFKLKDLLVNQWNATIEARGWMVAKNKAEKSKMTQLTALDNQAANYAVILGGYQYALLEKQKIVDEIKEVDTCLDAEKERIKVYENAQTIVGKLEIVSEGRKNIAVQRTRIEECDKVLKEYEPKIGEAKTKMDTCKELLDEQKDTIDKFAKTMRMKLHLGDKCPVCGQTIASELPHEEALEELVKGLNQKYEDAKNVFEDINGKVNKANGNKQTAEALLKTKMSDVESAETAVASFISGTWPVDWKVNPKAFSDVLCRDADTYRKKVERKQQLANRLDVLTNDCIQVEGIIGELQQMMPAWKVIRPSVVKELPKLIQNVNYVKSKTSAACELMEQAEQDIAANSHPLEGFLKEHPEISLERLNALNRHTPQQVATLQAALKKSKDDVLTTKTLMDEAADNHKEHLANKPELTEDDTVEALTARLVANEQKKSELNQQMGSIQKELDIDKENKKKIGELKKEASEKDAEYKKWSRLNELLGDATGNKFRRIAQSHVLDSLIHSANSYMKTLTDRYTLKVEPGTFVISIEDAYQGFASRAASTISGGESFLVSLALALALSDIGQKLNVDTLFIDEGFGTLSGEPLQNAIATLRSLHSSTGRHVGIISHVKDLREEIPVKIMVERDGHSSSSTVKVVPGMS